jgi:hypothetical protein
MHVLTDQYDVCIILQAFDVSLSCIFHVHFDVSFC